MQVHGHDVQTDYAAARRLLGVVPQELVFDPFFSVREALRIQSGYFGLRDNGAWIDELLEGLHARGIKLIMAIKEAAGVSRKCHKAPYRWGFAA